jgi:hypothetical protein
VESGEFAPVDPALAATFLLTALNGVGTWYRPDGRRSPAEIGEAYADLALRSLAEPDA